MVIFVNKVWLLDDFINDNIVIGNNNQFCIIDVIDINDVGVIFVIVLKCLGGYDMIVYNLLCSNCEEIVVVVKLVLIVNVISVNI